MDYNKIGKFITEERKKQKLTQAKLAEKLFVSEKTISKWENGNGVPDTNSLTKLCEVLNISLNELLNGERIESKNYEDKAEKQLLELEKDKEKLTKQFLLLEIFIGIMIVVFSVTTLLTGAYIINKYTFFGVLLILISLVVFVVGVIICLWIEQKMGYYVCKKCNHKYIPTFKQVLWSMHTGRTRYMKCPQCRQASWSKKVIK